MTEAELEVLRAAGFVAVTTADGLRFTRPGEVWSLANLESLCHRHHSQITRAEQLEDER